MQDRYGQLIGDELRDIHHQLSRIADLLETLSKSKLMEIPDTLANIEYELERMNKGRKD